MELENEMGTLIQEKEFLPLISDVSREFVKAHTTGDKEKLKKLLSDEMNLVEKDNKIYVKNDGDDFEWFLFDPQSEITFDDWVIQGYKYDIEAETFSVHIREFYSDINGESVSPPTFLNLTLKQQENEWIIINLAFDV